MLQLIKKAEAMDAGLIEIRLDYLNNPRDMKKIVKSTPLPLIATNRQYEQGGHRPQNEDQRVRTLLDAAQLGFQFVDVESTTADLDSITRQLKEMGAGLIVSFHDFKRTPNIAEMEKTIHSQIRAGADVCKFVTTANEAGDNISCLLLTLKMSKIAKVVCFAMGEKGIVSRVLSPLFGAHFTYASVEKGRETASGQPSVADLRELYRRLGAEYW